MKSRVRVFLVLQAVLCILVTGLFISSAVRIYREGSARKAEDPLEEIYTREKTEKAILPLTPLVLISLGMTAAGLALGIKDSKADKPVKDSGSVCRSAAERERQENGKKHSTRIRVILILAAMVFIVMGILNGSAKDVLYKAINICTECIGLG